MKAIGLLEEGLNGSRLISIAVKDIQAYVRLANLIKTNQSRLEEAHELCQRALSRSPDNFRATRETGHILLYMGKAQEAKTYLERAVELNPSEPNAHYLLSVAYTELDDLSQAESSLRRALVLVGSAEISYMIHLCFVLQQRGKLKEAEKL